MIHSISSIALDDYGFGFMFSDLVFLQLRYVCTNVQDFVFPSFISVEIYSFHHCKPFHVAECH